MTSNSAAPGSIGYGQMQPTDASSEFNTIVFIVRQMMSRMNTMKLVKVTAVSGTNTGDPSAVVTPGTVSVQPLVSQVDGLGNAVPYGALSGIPVFRMQSGSVGICVDPQVGDLGFIVCADRDISAVTKTQAAGTPGSWRRFDLQDGVYVGGLLGKTPPTTFISINSNGIAVVDKAGNKISMVAGGMTITAAGNNLTINGNIVVNGTIMATGNITAGLIDLQTHVHTLVTTGTSNSGPPTG